MALDPILLEILACPDDKSPLHLLPAGQPGGPALLCATCRRCYPVKDDIPVMLVEEAEQLSAEEATAHLERIGRAGATDPPT